MSKELRVSASAIICDYPKLTWARMYNSRLDGQLVLQPEALYFVFVPEVWLQASASNISHYLKILQIQISLQSGTLDTINRGTRTQKETENFSIHQSERDTKVPVRGWEDKDLLVKLTALFSSSTSPGPATPWTTLKFSKICLNELSQTLSWLQHKTIPSSSCNWGSR